MINAHGGKLISRMAEGAEREKLIARAKSLFQLKTDSRIASDCEMIANGGFSPLTGFMDEPALNSVLTSMTLPGGTVWAIPVVLPVNEKDSGKLKDGDEIALVNDGLLIAVMKISQIFTTDLDHYCQVVYKTTDVAHPGVKVVKDSGNSFLAGEIWLVNRPAREAIPDSYFLDPAQTREEFTKRGWKTIVAFQTRNPIHRAHEYLLKCAMEPVDGLLVHPLVGETKSDDIPADIRMHCYEALLDRYFSKARTMLSVLPAAMRYAGPREAVHHMIVRKNYGCTHMIIGRDHAGVGNYYGTYEAQELTDKVAGKLGIVSMKFEHTFFCNKCGNMASGKTCPHPQEDHVFLSGTKVRQLLSEGQRPPVEFTRPEVADVLIEWATSAVVSE